jgi:hypothetical protein
MTRFIGVPALTLGVMLAANGFAAADDTVRIGGTGNGKASTTGMTLSLGGKGSVASAASDDLELTRGGHGGGGGHGGFHGGYGGGFYGGGYRGGYYGGYRGGYGGYGGYRGYYGYRPYYVGYGYGYPYYGYGYGYPYSGYGYGGYGGYGSSGYGYGGYCGISGSTATTAVAVPLFLPSRSTTQVMTLGTPVTQSAPVSPAADFRYDGGPSAPVPTPAPAASPAPADETLPISLKAAPAPYRYKAYGEK